MKALRITAVVILVLVCVIIGLLGMRTDWIKPVPGVRLEPRGPVVRLSEVKADSAFAKLTNALFVMPGLDYLYDLAIAEGRVSLDTSPWSETVFSNIVGVLEQYSTNLDAVCEVSRTNKDSVALLISGGKDQPACYLWLSRAGYDSRLLVWRAIREAAMGRQEQAFDDLACVVGIGEIIGSVGGTIQVFIGMRCMSQACSAMCRLAVCHDVPKELAVKAIERLRLAETRLSPLMEACRCDWLCERTLVDRILKERDMDALYEHVDPSGGSGARSSLFTFVLGCAMALNAGRDVTLNNVDSYYSNVIDLAGKPYDSLAYEKLAPMEDGELRQVMQILGTRDPVGLLAIGMWGMYKGRYRQNYDRGICGLRIARLVLAIRQYEQAQGRSPTALLELVPDFIDSIPADPWDGAPLRYVLNSNRCWKVYSVGEDCVDNGGDMVSSSYESPDWGYSRIGGKDYVFPSDFGPNSAATNQTQR